MNRTTEVFGLLKGQLDEGKNISAVTRIRTWVIAATTQGTNHYTITAGETLQDKNAERFLSTDRE